MVLSRNLLVVLLSVFYLPGCVRQAPDAPAADVDPTDITTIEQAAAVGSESGLGAEGERSLANRGLSDTPQSEGESELDAATAGESDKGGTTRLNLSLPGGGEIENTDHLFAESDKGPNYFTSSETAEKKESVRIKGKLYMINEPSPEKQMQNVDGGEVGIIVPLK